MRMQKYALYAKNLLMMIKTLGITVTIQVHIEVLHIMLVIYNTKYQKVYQ